MVWPSGSLMSVARDGSKPLQLGRQLVDAGLQGRKAIDALAVRHRRVRAADQAGTRDRDRHTGHHCPGAVRDSACQR